VSGRGGVARRAVGVSEQATATACTPCLRRSWLLAQLAGPLDRCGRDRGRFLDVLALEEQQLLAALGGRRRAELARALARFEPGQVGLGDDLQVSCRHDPRHPAELRAPLAPRLLFFSGGRERLQRLLGAPRVAIVGGAQPSDYGNEVARGLARGLAASGATVLSGTLDGIDGACQEGAREAGAATIVVCGSGLDAAVPARSRALYRNVRRSGCMLSELPTGCGRRRFGALAAERVVLALASLVVLVEARAGDRALAAAREVQAQARPLAAVPGRVTSPLAAGPHELLRDGAVLVRDAADVLELLHPLPRASGAAARHDVAALGPRQRELIERVAGGSDTPELLCGHGENPAQVLLLLSELELAGVLVRGHGGRYLPCAEGSG